MKPAASMARLRRVKDPGTPRLSFTVNGVEHHASAGDTVLTVLLARRAALRATPFSGQPRAGFCLMGACQDCWVRTAEGGSVRACSTLLREGMALLCPDDADIARAGPDGMGARVPDNAASVAAPRNDAPESRP
ncbi:Sulfurtransferase [Bordetella sputigena]|uniref:(2Fe-2S)-binding protein n=1 Tax=Bordetella sputigena TaxID=1416810 RepID=UPI0039EF90AD